MNRKKVEPLLRNKDAVNPREDIFQHPVPGPDPAEKLRLVRELRGSTAGGPSLTDSLLRERRKEDAHPEK
ncbi:MAG: hypothetical protein WCC14_00505 [Acidobacteriaceae bacterium]